MRIPGLIVISLAGIGSLSSCGNGSSTGGAPQMPVPTVEVTTVTRQPVSYYDEYPATLSALNQIDLRAQVSGYLTGLYFHDGAHVQKGQLLYRIDPQTYDANYQQAEANLMLQETNLEKAQKDADRYHMLDQHNAIAKQQVDYADAALEAAKKQVEAAKAAVAASQTNVRYTAIYAPFSGTIGISQVKVGSPVSAGQTVLNTISSDNPMAADLSVDQGQIYTFTQLQQKKNTERDSTLRLAFGEELYPYPGTISVIDRAVDPQTSTIRMRLVFPNPGNELRAGMSGTVRVFNSGMEPQLLIPYKAVTEQLGEFFVYVVQDSTVNQRKVSLGRQQGNEVIIKNGLQEGERVVTEGVQNLHEGAVIHIAAPKAPASNQDMNKEGKK